MEFVATAAACSACDAGFLMTRSELLSALVWRPALARPWRTAVTVIGVAAGVAALVATTAASRSAVASFTRGVDEVAGRTAIEITTPGGTHWSTLATLAPLADEATVIPVVETSARLASSGEGVRVLGLDFLVDASARPALAVRGTQADFTTLVTGPSVLVSEAMAADLGLALGDTLALQALARTVDLTVVGIVDPGRQASLWRRMVVMDVALAQELFALGDRVTRIELVPRRADADVEALRRTAADLLPEGHRVAPPSRRRESGEALVAALRFNLTALSAISLLVGGVLVATTLATSVVQRRETLAILRTVGASSGQLAMGVLTEALIIGALGGAVGVAAGFAGGRLALTSVGFAMASVSRGSPPEEFMFQPWLAAMGMAVGIGLALVAAVLPVLEARRSPPLSGLRTTAPRPLNLVRRTRALLLASVIALVALAFARMPAVDGLPLAGLASALAVMAVVAVLANPTLDLLARATRRPLNRIGLPLVRLASAAVSAGRRRAAWATTAVAMAVALTVAISTMVVSFRTSVERWTENGMRADLWVRPLGLVDGRPAGSLDPEVVAIAEQLFGAEAVDPFVSVPAEYLGRPIQVAAAAFDVVARHGSVHFPGRDSATVFSEALAARGTVINESFARRFDVGEGDTLRLAVGGGTLTAQVIGVFADYSRSEGVAVVDRAVLGEFLPGLPPDSMALFLPDGTDAATARSALERATNHRWLLEIFDRATLHGEVLAAFDRTFQITTALAAVAGVVAGVAVLTVLMALVGERRRELAVLRSLGGSRTQLGILVVLQSLLMGLAATALGLAGGLAVGVVLVAVVNPQSFGWSLDLVWPVREVVVLSVWVLVACTVAALAPAAVAIRRAPATVLREE
jgi:putative ABC transport system permease protein